MLPNRRRSRRILLPRPAAQAPSKISTNAILARREKLIAEVKNLEEKCQLSSRSVGNMRRLLTRKWGESDWQARLQILKSANWFIGLQTALSSGGPQRAQSFQRRGAR